LNYQGGGILGLANKKPRARQIFNRIPAGVKEQVVEMTLIHPEKFCGQISWMFVDEMGYFLSESSVYRIPKGCDLVHNTVFQMILAKDKFEKPNQQVNELWQTDFT